MDYHEPGCRVEILADPARSFILNARRASFVYEGARLAAQAADAPPFPPPWEEREMPFKNQFMEVISRQCGEQRSRSPEELHGSWMQSYLTMGWVYGPEYSRENKTHPDLVPYADLGQLTRDKGAVFIALCEIARQWIYLEDKKEEENSHCQECTKLYDKLDMHMPMGLRPVLTTDDEILDALVHPQLLVESEQREIMATNNVSVYKSLDLFACAFIPIARLLEMADRRWATMTMSWGRVRFDPTDLGRYCSTVRKEFRPEPHTGFLVMDEIQNVTPEMRTIVGRINFSWRNNPGEGGENNA